MDPLMNTPSTPTADSSLDNDSHNSEKRGPGSYHHGNLRAALLQAAVELIREAGVEKLSLRGLARKVGVSQTAPYRHFQDKNHLLVEIAKQTFEELAQATRALIDPSGSATKNIEAAGKAYLNFAIHNPERYKLVFGPSIENRAEYPDLIDSGQKAFGILKQLVEAGIQQQELLDEDPQILSTTCWSNIHGFAALAIDGFYDRQVAFSDFDTLLNSHVRLSIRGIVR